VDEQLYQAGAIRISRSVSASRKWLRNIGAELFSPEFPGSFKMKPGDEEPPVFFIPGASGSILELAPLASGLTLKTPVYALAIKGHNEGETPDERIEDIAEHCVKIITKIRANGPYLLIGFSLGGVVALEIAQRLRLAGRTVPLVILLASYPSEKMWPLRCHIEIVRREIRASLRTVARGSWWDAAGYMFSRFCGLLNYLVQIFCRSSPLMAVSPNEHTAPARRVYVASLKALKNYRPSPYGGKVVLVAPLEKETLDPETPERIWQKFLTDLEVHSVPGSHLSLLDVHAVTTAEKISTLIEPLLTGRLTTHSDHQSPSNITVEADPDRR
jgi:thioesterase domain-containing protein